MKTSISVTLIVLSFLAMPYAAYSQGKLEAEKVIVDADKHLILKFTNKKEEIEWQRCGFLVGNKLINSQEEAFVIGVAHLHHRFALFVDPTPLRVGGPEVNGVSVPEKGWLFITRSRIVFTVEVGDKSHSFDVRRTDLKNKPVTTMGGALPTGIQMNLKERLQPSNSREQKFAFLMNGYRCQGVPGDPDPFVQFLKRTIKDFDGALAEFNQLTSSLMRSGKIQQARVPVMPGNSSTVITDSSNVAVSESPAAGPQVFSAPDDSKDPLEPPNPYAQRQDVPEGVYYALRSVADAQTGSMEQAKANAEKALRLLKTPSNDSEFYARGLAHDVLGNYDGAIADFDKALQLDPRRAAIYASRGNAYEAKNDYEHAIANFDRAIQLEPNRKRAYLDRARLFSSKKDWENSIADYDMAIQIDPEWAIAYLLRANDYYSKGDSARALADYNKAIQLDPKSVDAYSLRGMVYAMKGDFERAIPDFDKAIQLNPKETTAYVGRANAYFEKGNYDCAIIDFDKLIELTPQEPASYIGRGKAYSNKGDHERAMVDFDKAIQLSPQNAETYNLRGVGYARKGDFDHALADFNKAVELDPNGDFGYYNRAKAYFSKDDHDRAIVDLNKAIQLDPKRTESYVFRGAVYFKKGDDQHAVLDFSEAIRLEPDFILAFQNRAQAYERIGDKAKAQADRDKVLELEKQRTKP
jgi:tetratricopeptide (TPR) repeat protein